MMMMMMMIKVYNHLSKSLGWLPMKNSKVGVKVRKAEIHRAEVKIIIVIIIIIIATIIIIIIIIVEKRKFTLYVVILQI